MKVLYKQKVIAANILRYSRFFWVKGSADGEEYFDGYEPPVYCEAEFCVLNAAEAVFGYGLLSGGRFGERVEENRLHFGEGGENLHCRNYAGFGVFA